MQFLQASFVLYILKLAECTVEWGYHGQTGPLKWADLWPYSCADSKQSPIDIVPASAVPKNYTPFVLNGYRESDIPNSAGMEMTNNGRTVIIFLMGDIYISGGPLDTFYKAAEVYFHWGNTDDSGSEHTLLGQQYAAEMNIIHYDRRHFDSLSDAMMYNYGVVILSVFIEVGSVPNPTFDKIVRVIDKVKFKGDKYTFEKPFALRGLLPKKDIDTYFDYEGSLTTPECNEIVQWIVYRKPITVSRKQIGALRAVYANARSDKTRNLSMVNNFRPTQPLNGRTVYIARTHSGGLILNISLMAAIIEIAALMLICF